MGDACSLFSRVQDRLTFFPSDRVKELLQGQSEPDFDFDSYKYIDGLGQDALGELFISEGPTLSTPVSASILAYKRAISSCADDTHAQAVAWYNLGWAEHQAHVCLEQEGNEESPPTRFLRAAMNCFKRAIELEAGNAEFWNSLGVVTTTLSPKVAQHAFVRSLHLNERSVHVWTNLGALYLLQNDLELAHQAFSRAQSQDPDYSLAWVGEGIVALSTGNSNEAYSHFTHAFELSESSLLLTKQQYAMSAFDFLLASPSSTGSNTNVMQPLFALQQLAMQAPDDFIYKHLAALFLERVGNHDGSVVALRSVAEAAEKDYEESESILSLARVTQSKIDLARTLLAIGSNDDAVEEAETALDLLSELDSNAGKAVMPATTLAAVELSARLVAGLAHYFNGSFDAAISYFRSSLEATGSDPDIICLLAEVLWAKGGANERQVARDQLFTAIEKHEGHTGLLTLIGAMSVVDDDSETMDAIRDDLNRLRTSKELSDWHLARVEKVVEAISTSLGGQDQELHEARRSVMLAPWKHTGWIELDDAAGRNIFASTLTKETALKNAPPNGTLDAVSLAQAVAATGQLRDTQRAVVLAPWYHGSWAELTGCVAAAK